jgi:endonuclease III
MNKIPFDIDLVLEQIEAAVRPYPKAALFELAEEGFNTPFEQLIACIISIRTLDEVTLPVSRRLFALARTPQAFSRLTATAVDECIRTASFHERKAGQILAIARQLVAEFGGELPCDRDLLLSFAGVGPKCANLALGIACGQPVISVDVHVHRVTNRWGFVGTKTPEKTMLALEASLPPPYWLDINRLLVPFGKHICTGRLPRCSTCPVLALCRQVGVTAHR